MNKGPDDPIPGTEAWQKFDRKLFLGPCFDLDLTATEAIEAFEEKKKLQSHRMPANEKPPRPKVSVPSPLGNPSRI